MLDHPVVIPAVCSPSVETLHITSAMMSRLGEALNDIDNSTIPICRISAKPNACATAPTFPVSYSPPNHTIYGNPGCERKLLEATYFPCPYSEH